MNIHFSIDDVFDELMDLSNPTFTSLWDHEFFRLLQDIHQRFEIEISLYLFLEDHGHSLEKVSSRFLKEFVQATWLHFGFHAKSKEEGLLQRSREETRVDYRRFKKECSRFAGSSSITDTIRLHYYQGTLESLMMLYEEGVRVILSSEDQRIPYHFDAFMISTIEEKMCFLDTLTNLKFQKTHGRIESIHQLDDFVSNVFNKKIDPLVVFTHAWALRNPKIIKKTFDLLDSIQNEEASSHN